MVGFNALATSERTVLHVLPQITRDLVGRTVVDICRQLRKEGWKAIVATGGGQLEREIVTAGAELVEIPFENTGPIANWRNTARLTRLCRKRGVRLVHAHRRQGAWCAGQAAKRSGAVFLGTVHDLSDVTPRRPRRRDDLVLTAGDRVVAVSEYVAESLTGEAGVERARVRVIPPGVDMAELDPERVRGQRVAALAERWNLGEDKKVVLLPAPMYRDHGHLAVMRAMAKLERTDFLLLFLGTDEAQPGFVKQIENLVRAGGIGERVRFAGSCPDIPAALQLADVVVLPMGQPVPSARTIVAAQAMGRPVIVSSLGAMPEAMMPGSTGWVVPPEDNDELAWAIDRALSLDEEVRERMVVRAREFVASTFALEVVGRRQLDLYEELSHGGTGRR